jgi:hypothetical protein
MKQIAVSAVNFDNVEAGCGGTLRGLRKGANDGSNPREIEGLGHCVLGREGDGAGGDGLPATLFRRQQALAIEGRSHAGFAAGVGQLNSGTSPLGVDEAGDLRKFGDVVVFPDAQIAAGDAAFREHGGSLKHHETSAALGAAAEMYEVPIGGKTVLRRVLAHGRNADAIGEVDGSKLQWGEKGLAHWGLVRGL